ncbi:MAG TPA: DUF2231 domain-containing protein [Streptosporangiaceae bacterium]|nr:DUF2231 domain-containing protein [Streptosporangiaceae bacterium]
MHIIDRLEQVAVLDPVVSAGQRAVRLIRPGKARDALNGVWLGHPVHPALVQAAVGAWLSASIMDLAGDREAARLLAAAGLAAAVPAAAAGAADWSEQHEQQMRVGVVHAAGRGGPGRGHPPPRHGARAGRPVQPHVRAPVGGGTVGGGTVGG